MFEHDVTKYHTFLHSVTMPSVILTLTLFANKIIITAHSITLELLTVV